VQEEQHAFFALAPTPAQHVFVFAFRSVVSWFEQTWNDLVQIYRIECLPLESAMIAETRTAWRTRSASRARVRLFIFSLPLLAARH
jgi:hypothetical protein